LFNKILSWYVQPVFSLLLSILIFGEVTRKTCTEVEWHWMRGTRQSCVAFGVVLSEPNAGTNVSVNVSEDRCLIL
jgi:hypothetical protein